MEPFKSKHKEIFVDFMYHNVLVVPQFYVLFEFHRFDVFVEPAADGRRCSLKSLFGKETALF